MSSNIEKAERVGENLVVTFKNGGRYTYYDVPASVYAEYQEAESKGSFLAKNIRGRYRTQKHED